MTAIEDSPLWALTEAVRLVLKGEWSGNAAFAPTPPQLAEIVSQRMQEARLVKHRFERLLRAEVEPSKPTAEDYEKRAAQVDELVAKSLKPTAAYA